MKSVYLNDAVILSGVCACRDCLLADAAERAPREKRAKRAQRASRVAELNQLELLAER